PAAPDANPEPVAEAPAPRPAQAHGAPAHPAARKADEAQPRLGGLDPSDRIQGSPDEDMLDIPAFLRRQAN
ncbi:MAG: cell division protein FtsZ, partial [Rhodobacterales bacterium]|nr:cell division protein FtsZ [Rhodobacterales bacterium]